MGIYGMSKRKQQHRVKRWEIPDETNEKILVAVGGKTGRNTKLIIKSLEKGLKEHLTLWVGEDGRFDIHKKQEGEIPTYITIAEGRINLEQLEEKMFEIYQKSIKPIDVNNPAYQDFVVLVPKSTEALGKFYDKYYPIKKRRMIYPDKRKLKEMEQKIYDYFNEAYVDEIFEYDSGFAFAFDPKGDLHFLFFGNDECYMLSVSEPAELLSNSFQVEVFHCPECGTRMPQNVNLCPKCGWKVE